MGVLIWIFPGAVRNTVIKTEHGSHQKLSRFGYRSRRHGADAACIRNPPSHHLSLQEDTTTTSTRGEAGLEVTHSCSCAGSRASSCCYPCGVGKTSPKLDPVPTSWLKRLGPHNSSGLTVSSNAPGSSQAVQRMCSGEGKSNES